jgi:hypothetical protein
VLVDDQQWGADPVLSGRPCLPFLERDGTYWGRPADDAEAIGELQRMRGNGARAVVFGWSTFWWLDQYRGFASYLHEQHRCIESGPDVKIFSLD